jgi:quercetin dioxygenase-like cupin family protein
MIAAIYRPRSRNDGLMLVALMAVMIGAGLAQGLAKLSFDTSAWRLDDDILCMSQAAVPGDRVEPVASYPLANAPGKYVTIVRVIYGPGGFTPPHYHAGTVTAYIVRGAIRSQLQGGPVETFTAGQTFFEPPGSVHMVSANASDTEEAELLAIFVADHGAQLTTFL